MCHLIWLAVFIVARFYSLQSECSFLLINLFLRLGGCQRAIIRGCWKIAFSISYSVMIGCIFLILVFFFSLYIWKFFSLGILGSVYVFTVVFVAVIFLMGEFCQQSVYFCIVGSGHIWWYLVVWLCIVTHLVCGDGT